MITLSHLCVDNYRSLYQFSLALNPLTILIGRNDAGKSSVLGATRLLLDDAATSSVEAYDWSRAARATQFPRTTVISGELSGRGKVIIRRQITIHKSKPATSLLEIQDGDTWRLLTPTEQQEIPSVYYLKPRTGALQEQFDPAKENNIFSLVKDWMPASIA